MKVYAKRSNVRGIKPLLSTMLLFLWGLALDVVAEDDIIWQRGVFGEVHYWAMGYGQRHVGDKIGPHRLPFDFLEPDGAIRTWFLRGVGDVDGDGDDDIIWQHESGQVHYWRIQNGNRQDGVNIGNPVHTDWVLRGVGDVEGDGDDDIIWQHRWNGQVHYWPMQNGQPQDSVNIDIPVDTNWIQDLRLRGFGDVDGDGDDDIIWQHADGQVHYWPMQNGKPQPQDGVNIGNPVHTDWVLRGVGDVDGNGDDDIIWQHTDGLVHYWPMQNGQRDGPGKDIHFGYRTNETRPGWAVLRAVGNVVDIPQDATKVSDPPAAEYLCSDLPNESIFYDNDLMAVTRNARDKNRLWSFALVLGKLCYRIGQGEWQGYENPEGIDGKPVYLKSLAVDNNRLFVLTLDGELYYRAIIPDPADWVIDSMNAVLDIYDWLFPIANAALGNFFPLNALPTLRDPYFLEEYRQWSWYSRFRWNKIYPSDTQVPQFGLEGDEIIDIAVGHWDLTVVNYYALVKTSDGRFVVKYIDEEYLMSPIWQIIPFAGGGPAAYVLNEESRIDASHSVVATIARVGDNTNIVWTRYSYHNEHDFEWLEKLPEVPLIGSLCELDDYNWCTASFPWTESKLNSVVSKSTDTKNFRVEVRDAEGYLWGYPRDFPSKILGIIDSPLGENTVSPNGAYDIRFNINDDGDHYWHFVRNVSLAYQDAEDQKCHDDKTKRKQPYCRLPECGCEQSSVEDSWVRHDGGNIWSRLEDWDGDGVKDLEEICFDGDCKHYTEGADTDPGNPDTDGDGVNDGAEVQSYSTNPLNSDTDSDGLSDGDEVNIHHTNPLHNDTDSDGLSDGDEVNIHHTDPLNIDTDGDGLSDGDEVNIHHTNPLNIDTDGDGLGDSNEINIHHTDPLVLNDVSMFCTGKANKVSTTYIPAIMPDTYSGQINAAVKDHNGTLVSRFLFSNTTNAFVPVSCRQLPVINSNGAPGLAILGVNKSTHAAKLELRNTLSGNLLRTVNLDSEYEPQDMAVVDDLNGNGYVEVAVLAIGRSNGNRRASIFDTNTGRLVRHVWFTKKFTPLGLISVPDINQNGYPELAMFGHNADTNEIKVEIKDARDGDWLRSIPFDEDRFDPIDFAWLPDISQNGVEELVILGRDMTTGKLKAAIKDMDTGLWVNEVWFNNLFVPQKLVVTPDLNGNGTPDLGLLGTSEDEPQVRVELKDSYTAVWIGFVWSNPVYKASDFAVLPDINSDGAAELVILGRRAINGSNRVIIKDSLNDLLGEFTFN